MQEKYQLKKKKICKKSSKELGKKVCKNGTKELKKMYSRNYQFFMQERMQGK